MKSFTKEQIDASRKNLQAKYPHTTASLDNRVVDYLILPKDLFGGIPNGLFRMTGKPSAGYLVGVSDEVPEILRPSFAMSEHDEFMVYGLQDLDRTLHSEQNMVNILRNQGRIKNSYVEKKLELYNFMLENASANPKWDFKQEDIDGFTNAVKYLNSEL